MEKARFDAALENFRLSAEIAVRAHFNRCDFTFAVPGVKIASKGRRFAKLVSFELDCDGRSVDKGVHSFVDIETGEIFKPKTYKAPAKHARGNIFNDHGRRSLTDTGSVKYLR